MSAKTGLEIMARGHGTVRIFIVKTPWISPTQIQLSSQFTLWQAYPQDFFRLILSFFNVYLKRLLSRLALTLH